MSCHAIQACEAWTWTLTVLLQVLVLFLPQWGGSAAHFDIDVFVPSCSFQAAATLLIGIPDRLELASG